MKRNFPAADEISGIPAIWSMDKIHSRTVAQTLTDRSSLKAMRGAGLMFTTFIYVATWSIDAASESENRSWFPILSYDVVIMMMVTRVGGFAIRQLIQVLPTLVDLGAAVARHRHVIRKDHVRTAILSVARAIFRNPRNTP